MGKKIYAWVVHHGAGVKTDGYRERYRGSEYTWVLQLVCLNRRHQLCEWLYIETDAGALNFCSEVFQAT